MLWHRSEANRINSVIRSNRVDYRHGEPAQHPSGSPGALVLWRGRAAADADAEVTAHFDKTFLAAVAHHQPG